MQKLFTTQCLLFCAIGIAQAHNADNFEFVTQPYYKNIVCGDPVQNATYTIKNNESVPIIITYINLTQDDPFPADLIQVDMGPLTTCKIGSALAGKAPCNINLVITPAACVPENFSADVKRLLYVGINTWEKEIVSDLIFFKYRIGPIPPPPTPADAFALLGEQVDNLGSVSSIIGSVGHTGNTPITGNYTVTDGVFYTSPTDPVVITVNNDFLTIYNTFISNIEGCRPRTDLDAGDIIQSSYYCLTSNSGQSYVSVDGLITLSGPGDFVFFIDSVPSTCFSNSAPSSVPCDVKIGSNTRFIYTNGASPKNVYWIVGPGHEFFLASGAALDGTVLSGGNISSDVTGPNPSTVSGRLWSLQTITLYGDTVAIHP
ncbi:MAG: ice-binding family protein [Gammaproteobacteria bacterium]